MDGPAEVMTPGAYNWTYGGNKAFHNFANDYSHISDPNLRRRLALSEIDKVPFGLYLLVAGVGFFLDSYDIFSINLITTMLGVVFWSGPASAAANGFGGNDGTLPTSVNTALKTSTSAGIIVGQVLFGWLADVFGRRRMYGIELGIIVLSTLNCALASGSQSMSSTGILIFWRVMMGVGIGGDYPLSSVITSEFAPTRWRGAMMAAVFSMQGIGQLLCAIIALIVAAAFKEPFLSATTTSSCDYACQTAADQSWRILVGCGALPACFALYYRITIPETPRYTFDVVHDVEKADADIKAYMASQNEGVVDPVQRARMLKVASPSLNIPAASWRDIFSYFGRWKNARVLLGTTTSWFFLDLAYYGLGLNNTVVLEAIGYATGPTLYHTLYNNAVGMIILTCAGSLPGYWAAIFTIDTFGRKPLQLFGFLILAVLFCVLGFCYDWLSEASLLVLYIIAQFFFNWGPNTTTFIIPGECFPTRYRSTGHGLSAAMGKIGAIVAQLISIPLLGHCPTSAGCNPWLARLMQIFALFMLCGTFSSLLVPETRGVTLEELAGEAPTTYNAGRNGSIGGGGGGPYGGGGGGYTHDDDYDNGGGGGAATAAAFIRRWNPFAGGQPAGFFYPRVGGYHSRRRGRSPRMGIMASPEMEAQNNNYNNKGGHGFGHGRGHSHGHNRGGGGGGKESVSSVGAGRGGGGGVLSLGDAAIGVAVSTSGGHGRSGALNGNSTTSTSKHRGGGSTAFGSPGAKGEGGGGGAGGAWRKERGFSAESDDYAFSSTSGSDEVPMAAAGVLPGWGAGWGRIDRGGQQTTMENIRLQDVGSLLK